MLKEKTISKEPQMTMIIRPLASAAPDKVLFEDSLRNFSVGQAKTRTWATFVSFILELLVLGVLLLLPLWFTDVLPRQQLITFLEAPPPPPPPPPPAPPSRPKVVKVSSNIVNGQLRTPSRIPEKVRMIKEDDAPPPVTGGVVGGVPGGIPGGQLNGVLGGIVSSIPAAIPASPKPAPSVQRVRLSQGVTKGLLIYRIEPTYPLIAQQARIQGVVVLTAIIGKDGSVQRLQLVNGNPLLAPAAIEAVKKWRYKPFLLNGQAVEIETTVTVTFSVRSG